MNDSFGEYNWRVRSSDCGPDASATLPALCNWFQEAAHLHAESLKFSKSDFNSAGENVTWVLTRLRIEINRLPNWEEPFTLLTFPRGGKRIVAWRDFSMSSESGESLAVASSEWMVIDLSSRKIQPIPPRVFSAANTARTPLLGENPFSKRLDFPPSPPPSAPLAFRAQHSHIDMNGHVNNVRYVEWLLEPVLAQIAAGALPPSQPKSVEIVYRSETLAGDTVLSSVAPGPNPGEFLHLLSDPSGKPHVTARTLWK